MIQEINYLAKNRIPFLFILDYLCSNPIILPLTEVTNDIQFDFNGFSNSKACPCQQKTPLTLSKKPVAFQKYQQAFNYLTTQQKNGYSYLANLTFPTEINLNLSLEDIFYCSKARYRLLYRDQFVVFSPETFIKINQNTISAYPMKGTIDAAIPNAADIILADEKEASEHATIVDLIRNDLSTVAKQVRVDRYRYIEEIHTCGKNLLQVSSQISGILPPNYREKLGNILYALLPAGSVTGAPKPKTLDIIKNAENYERGYYTGVCGYFDGENLDSGVMIRFIEKIGNSLYYKSGGGITAYSNPLKEYQEMIDKVYVPIN